MKIRALGIGVAVTGILVAMSGTAHADHEMVVVAGKTGEAPSTICASAGMSQAAFAAQETAGPVALLQAEKVPSAYVGSFNDIEADLVLRDNGVVAPYVQQVNDTQHALCTKSDTATSPAAKTGN
ncbi:hypothetical protein [Nocardia sp. XZ_19_385]|uniref:hypothetical protein n=1 Tax=Nocardia sp. XZ_19_385 TaxID=2769488 RepID=UPI00188E95CD|nr:hypothetical protein [Nocardia sp. XZ_19_385]